MMMRVRPIEGEDDLVEAAMDLLRAHVRLIMVGTLTMEESKPVLSSAFSALGRFDLDNRGSCLSYIGGGLESLLAAGKGEVNEACDGGCSSSRPREDCWRLGARLERRSVEG